jgi:hypothetical protein
MTSSDRLLQRSSGAERNKPRISQLGYRTTEIKDTWKWSALAACTPRLTGLFLMQISIAWPLRVRRHGGVPLRVSAGIGNINLA